MWNATQQSETPIIRNDIASDSLTATDAVATSRDTHTISSAHRERIRVDTTSPFGTATLIADIEFDDAQDTQFHGTVCLYTHLAEPRIGRVSGLWYRLQRSNSLDIDLNLSPGPSRLSIDVFSNDENHLHGQWTTPHGVPHLIDAHVIFDSYAQNVPAA